jgi:predicted DNA-binding transcriptional regulator YafY
MYTVPPKKMLAMNILDLLRKNTDGEHRLSQTEILELLRRDYQMEVERKAVRRNLMDLIAMGYDIEHSVKERRKAGGGAEEVLGDWYIVREFEDSELRLLIDSVLLSHQIPTKQRKELIRKLQGLSSRYFEAKSGHVSSLPEVKHANKQLFHTIDMLDEAMGAKRKVEFEYGSFGTDGKLHPRRRVSGEVRRYVVDPYQMVATNGRYYLIGRYGEHEELTYYRIDRILDIVVSEEPALPLTKLPGYANGLDLPRHLAEHVYMFSGKPVRVRLRVKKWVLDHIFDWFGDEVVFENEDAEGVDVLLQANERALGHWVMQFAAGVEVLEPETLRASLLTLAEGMVAQYGD